MTAAAALPPEPPRSSPSEIKADLLPEEVPAFERDYQRALKIAGDTWKLDELYETLAHWRLIAAATRKDPEARRRMFAAADEVQRTGAPRQGSVSLRQLKAELGL
ncbi:DUF6247 family protein [Actinokineospora soli]|uniref:DUF6247 family protein n=1 Tax=Actinokineospora soli TaxID=1048753 RepID=A0ABW2TGQ7_9PSEU